MLNAAGGGWGNRQSSENVSTISNASTASSIGIYDTRGAIGGTLTGGLTDLQKAGDLGPRSATGDNCVFVHD